MNMQELPARAFLAHLRRHPIPEIMDEECLAALANVEAQFGDTITHGAGLEVRLGNPDRFVDYVMCVDQDRIPSVKCIWYEIDYADFLRGGEISPCLFINTSDYKQEETDKKDRGAGEENGTKQEAPLAAAMGKEFWDRVLPPFAGEKRATRLRGQLDRVLAMLPPDATIKQIGTMSPRGELDILRLVIIFRKWENVFAWLRDVGWPGDTQAMEQALSPWKESQSYAVNVDLGENGVLEKTGLEVFDRWRHPLIVDKFISRLEETGLCLPSKGAALRRWIRISPDGDPFIQTLISYFKLNYAKGRVTEAKAYLEQSPYIHHHYFSHYERPARLDMELADGKTVLPEERALARLRECKENRVSTIRFYGGENYEPLERILQVCRKEGLRSEIVLTRQKAPENAEGTGEQNLTPRLGRSWLEAMAATGADSFLVDMESETDGAALWAIAVLREQGADVRARWRMYAANAGKLAAVVKAADEAGAKELVVTGMKPSRHGGGKSPGCEQIAAAAEWIKEYCERNGAAESTREKESPEAKLKENSAPQQDVMQIVVESCFSPLRAYLGGKDPKRNGNRGIERGCEAGCSFMVLRADESFAPCLYWPRKNADNAEGRQALTGLAEYWEHSPALQALRQNGENRVPCAGCCYERRCLPCQAWEESIPCGPCVENK